LLHFNSILHPCQHCIFISIIFIQFLNGSTEIPTGNQTETNWKNRPSKLSEDKLSEDKGSEDKQSYGEFANVLLKAEEHQKLVEKLGERNTKVLIEELSTYLESKGAKYRSHYATLLNWARRKYTEHQRSQKPTRKIA